MNTKTIYFCFVYGISSRSLFEKWNGLKFDGSKIKYIFTFQVFGILAVLIAAVSGMQYNKETKTFKNGDSVNNKIKLI